MIRFVFLFAIATSLAACQTSSKIPSQNKNDNTTAPKLTKPVVRKIWIPDKIEDDGLTMTGGHWKYLIDKGASWAN